MSENKIALYVNSSLVKQLHKEHVLASIVALFVLVGPLLLLFFAYIWNELSPLYYITAIGGVIGAIILTNCTGTWRGTKDFRFFTSMTEHSGSLYFSGPDLNIELLNAEIRSRKIKKIDSLNGEKKAIDLLILKTAKRRIYIADIYFQDIALARQVFENVLSSQESD